MKTKNAGMVVEGDVYKVYSQRTKAKADLYVHQVDEGVVYYTITMDGPIREILEVDLYMSEVFGGVMKFMEGK